MTAPLALLLTLALAAPPELKRARDRFELSLIHI